MIAADQPVCFPESVIASVSSKKDGSMLDRADATHASGVVANRHRFCQAAGVPYEQAVYQLIEYGSDQSYDTVVTVGERDTSLHRPHIPADALYTTRKWVALFLPVADCVAMVLHDSTRGALALAHVGRHASYAKLATKVARHVIADGSAVEDIVVWMSPHAQKQSYKMQWFDQSSDPDWQGYFTVTSDGVFLDMAGYNAGLLTRTGILQRNIHISSVDTMTDTHYFSHTQGDTSGRIAVVACMRQ